MSETLLIREGVAEDLPACAAIINDYIDATGWLPRLRSRDEIAAAFGPVLLLTRRLVVAEDAGRVVGYMTLTPEGRLPALYLRPEMRGRGIGARLVAEAKAAHPAGLTLTVFEPNAAALRFYARHGFVEVPEERDETAEEGVAVLLLRWLP